MGRVAGAHHNLAQIKVKVRVAPTLKKKRVENDFRSLSPPNIKSMTTSVDNYYIWFAIYIMISKNEFVCFFVFRSFPPSVTYKSG